MLLWLTNGDLPELDVVNNLTNDTALIQAIARSNYFSFVLQKSCNIFVSSNDASDHFCARFTRIQDQKIWPQSQMKPKT